MKISVANRDGDSRRSGMGGSHLSVKDIWVSFGGIKAIQGMNLEMAAGERVGLIGANGAGKSTLIRVLSGELRPDQGQATYGDTDLIKLAIHRHAQIGIGRTFQHAQLFSHLTLADNVLVGARGDHDEANKAITLLGLGKWSSRIVSKVPYGIQKLTELARALAGGCQLLITDEPTAGLTRTEKNDVADILVHICDQLGLSLLVVEHDLGLIRKCCERVYVMDLGRCIFEGSPGQALIDQKVIGAYLGGAST